MIKMEILNKDGFIKNGKNNYEEDARQMLSQGEAYACIATQHLQYEIGDYIRVSVEKPDCYLVVKLDETLDSTLIYLKNNIWEYIIPLEEGASSPDARFKGKTHYLSVRYAKDYEVKQYRNLAFNPHDQKECSGAFPHASANVETRNDSTFFAKNAIDGVYASHSHGSYPYQSWGINRNPQAELTIHFGRKVCVDSVGLILRADFPHDSYWKQVSLRFSDGSSQIFETKKTGDIQTFSFVPVTTEYVVFEKLIKADDDSPFPALTQMEVYGTEIHCAIN